MAVEQGKKTLLIVDDTELFIQLQISHLGRKRYNIHTAKNGNDGLEMARSLKPDLILLDVMMPEMDGLEVLMELKWDKKLKKIPIFMLTAKSTVGDMDHAFNRRADGYIVKPFDGATLGDTIRNKLEEIKNEAQAANH